MKTAEFVSAFDPLHLPCVHNNKMSPVPRDIRRFERFILDRVCRTTIRELRFWGWSRVRRANYIFSSTYDDTNVAQKKGRKRKRVSFAPPERLHIIHPLGQE